MVNQNRTYILNQHGIGFERSSTTKLLIYVKITLKNEFFQSNFTHYFYNCNSTVSRKTALSFLSNIENMASFKEKPLYPKTFNVIIERIVIDNFPD